MRYNFNNDSNFVKSYREIIIDNIEKKFIKIKIGRKQKKSKSSFHDPLKPTIMET